MGKIPKTDEQRRIQGLPPITQYDQYRNYEPNVMQQLAGIPGSNYAQNAGFMNQGGGRFGGMGFSPGQAKDFYSKESQSKKDTPFTWGGMFSKMGNWMGDNPMKAAGIGLGLWEQYNIRQQQAQNKEYMQDVRGAMEFDQADVNRRWDLTMKDWEARNLRDAGFDHAQRLPGSKVQESVPQYATEV